MRRGLICTTYIAAIFMYRKNDYGENESIVMS